jgi:cell division septation protein DedD
VRIPGEDDAPFRPKPPAQKPAPPDKKTRRRTRSKEEFFVPIGAFASPENVTVEARGGEDSALHRGRRRQPDPRARGPFPSREAAEEAATKLKGLGLEPGAVTAK